MTGASGRRISIVTNTGWNMVRFRSGLLARLVEEGWQVVAVADFRDEDAERVRSWGAEPVSLPVEGSGTNPAKDLRYLAELLRLYRRLRPDVVHHFSIKPVVYGSLAAKWSGVPRVVSSITGLGSGYLTEQSWLQRLVKALYRAALSGRTFAVFQNRDDLEQLLDQGMVIPARSALIPGSGVDTDLLTPDSSVPVADRNAFIMVSRMLWSKGVADFAEAARRVRSRHPQARFLLFGGSSEDYGSKNADFVPRAWLEALNREGIVEWRGWTPPAEVESWMQRCAAVIHPSYYPEGVPRSLIEAAAAGAPIITTDSPGCRDTVVPELSGLLCPAHSPEALAEAMSSIAADPARRERMGLEGRRLAVERFDQRIVLERLLEIYEGTSGGVDASQPQQPTRTG
jgi:glycosyltransferase involved in cell wall biosynthesis